MMMQGTQVRGMCRETAKESRGQKETKKKEKGEYQRAY
jgi:hypothetical protein